MSLIISYFDEKEKQFYLWVDGRIYHEEDGQNYVLLDDYKRTYVCGNKVICLTGNLGAINESMTKLTNEESVNSVRNKLIDTYNSYINRVPDELLELGACVFSVENGIGVVYQISSENGFIINKTKTINQNLFVISPDKSSEVLQYIKDEVIKDNNFGNVVYRAYNYFCGETIGGNIIKYYINEQGVEAYKTKILDCKMCRCYQKKAGLTIKDDIDGEVV